MYVPHRGGTELGIHQRAPWLDGNLAEATRGPRAGQPVFTDHAAAFGWLDRARTDQLGALDLSIAAVAATPHIAADGLRRIAVDRAALHDPAAQVVRGINTHWLRQTTLTWVERTYGHAMARAHADHTDAEGSGATATYVRASLSEIAVALARLNWRASSAHRGKLKSSSGR